jgi:hypothetical protein
MDIWHGVTAVGMVLVVKLRFLVLVDEGARSCATLLEICSFLFWW